MQVVLGDAITAYEEQATDAQPKKQLEAVQVDSASKEHKLKPETPAEESHRWTTAGMFALVDACYMATAFNTDTYGLTAGGTSGDWWVVQVVKNALSLAFLVTAEDRDAFVTTTVYVVYYCIRFEVRTEICVQTGCTCA